MMTLTMKTTHTLDLTLSNPLLTLTIGEEPGPLGR